jgi:hypothetical protein
MWRNRVVDGQKREAICGELGIAAPIRHMHSLQEACSALWALHPERAVALALEGAPDATPLLGTVNYVARLCSARVAAVALIINGKPKPEKRSPRRTRSKKTELVQVFVDPQWRHFVRKAGEREGLNLSATIRVACWEYVQRILPKVATEGERRGPGLEMVRPREIRKLKTR